jgi:hypothetical protein
MFSQIGHEVVQGSQPFYKTLDIFYFLRRDYVKNCLNFFRV